MKNLTRKDFRCFHRLRVRWVEVDMQKIVFNAHYLMYFDTAMSDYWRALAMPYEPAMQQLEGDLYVKKATVEYHASARMDELLDVALRCARVGNSSIVFQGVIFRGDQVLITAELLYVFADPTTQKARPVPQALREIFRAYEAGEDMLRVQCGDWSTLGPAARALRLEVFVQEQGIPKEMECDQADTHALHAVVFNRLGQAVGTGRLLAPSPNEPATARVGRMAVHRVLRGSQVGRRLMQALMDAAAARGDQRVALHAQRSAEGFYARLGFGSDGEPFEEAGIAHIGMVRLLREAQASPLQRAR